MPMCACIGVFFGLLLSAEKPPTIIDPFVDNYAYGTISQYNPGLMEETIRNNVAWGHVPRESLVGVDVFAAVLDCRHIGRRGWITWEDGQRERLLVVDCANPQHVETVRWMVDENVIAEVGYRTAARRGFVGRGVIATVELAP